jgi:hypothetical protein
MPSTEQCVNSVARSSFRKTDLGNLTETDGVVIVHLTLQ